MELRRYRSSDCSEMAQLFYDTIHTVNAVDYTPDQLNAWADGDVDMDAWDKSFSEHYSIIAVDGDRIAGFGDMDSSGYLDRLYVHRDYQGRGVGTAICDCLEQWTEGRGRDDMGGEKGPSDQIGQLSVHASITARPFFERRGYRVVREQMVERKGQRLVNYSMVKDMG